MNGQSTLIRRERDAWLFKADINLAARRDKLTHEAGLSNGLFLADFIDFT
jgi:hypothetical protein